MNTLVSTELDQTVSQTKAIEFKQTISELKRVALFSGNYNCVVDGANKALNQLVAFLEKKGVEVLVFAPTVKKPAFEPAGTLVSVPSIPIPGRSEYRVAWTLTSDIKKQLKAFNPDLVHLSAPDILGYSALKWALRNAIPIVSSFHTRFDTYPRYYRLAWLERHVRNYMRHFYQQCDHVYSPSATMTEFLEEENMGKDIREWSRGIDTELFNPNRRDMRWRQKLGINPDEKVLLFVGRLVLEKGLDMYASILDELTQKGVSYKALVVGDGPERASFQKRLPDAIFTGFLEGEGLAQAYASADIFINPSVTETFGNVTLEALASGLPCVCADAGGARNLVAHGTTGFLVDPSTTSEYVKRLTELISHAQLHRKMATESSLRQKAFTWDSVLQKVYDQYIEVLAGRCMQAIDSGSEQTLRVGV